MPALGESVTEGTVTRWLKSVGDQVEAGDPLLEVSTDKVDTEVVSTSSGVIEALLVEEEQTVQIGTPLAVVSTPGVDDASAHGEAGDVSTVDPATSLSSVGGAEATARPLAAGSSLEIGPPVARARTSRTGPFLSPLVRKLVAHHRVDPLSITGTGLGGRVRRDDVLAAARQQAGSVSHRGTSVPMSRLRRVIATRAVESMSSTAQLTTVVEVDVTRVERLRQEHKDHFRSRTGVGLSFLPFFAVAAAEALRQFPIINARIEGDTLVYPSAEHIGFAVDTDRGLFSPVVHHAENLSVSGFARAIDGLARRARDGLLTPDELAGATFTITNTGSRGALFDTPVVFLPQVAILGTGKVTRRPVVLTAEGQDVIAIRSMAYLALSYDHRAVDGADAARFLGAVRDRLEAADFIVD
jgi:2-oxoglutarate dehydrogenase E2 component (dihydrolipoamide succinyltransferase)